MTNLYDPITFRGLTIDNRIWISPMCQYSAVDGVVNDWHYTHYTALAVGRPGVIITESNHVNSVGRITPKCAGIWSDEQTQAWARIVSAVHALGVPFGTQLSHAGRKASTKAPFDGIGFVDEGGWETLGASPIPFGDAPAPRELTVAEIEQTVADFVEAAKRAVAAGFDLIEIHGGHGYLIHQFLSPITNQRTDEYGGSLENRSRLLAAVASGIRAVIPETMPLFVRISATDWIEGGFELAEAVEVAKTLKGLGVDLIDASGGGLDVLLQKIPFAPGYQVPFATAIKEQVGIPASAVGLITQPQQVADIIESGAADAVFIAKQALRERMFPLLAASALGIDRPWPKQYGLAKPPLAS